MSAPMLLKECVDANISSLVVAVSSNNKYDV